MSKAPKSIVAFITSAALVLGSCQSTSPQLTELDLELEPRAGGAPPPGLAAEVDQLRANGLTIHDSTSVGALAAKPGVTSRGDATYSIPIDVAPGPAGMSPSLALAYNGSVHSGNGNVGVGFALEGFGSIRRCSENLQVDGAWEGVFAGSNALCLGSNRLLLAAGTQGEDGSEYRTLPDTHTKIVLHGDIDDLHSWFEVFDKDGTISKMGESPATLSKATSNPDEPVPYAWLLRQRLDRYGNAIDYEYEFGLNPITVSPRRAPS